RGENLPLVPCDYSHSRTLVGAAVRTKNKEKSALISFGDKTLGDWNNQGNPGGGAGLQDNEGPELSLPSAKRPLSPSPEPSPSK
ncbi:unnamed protein product, partial [Allacma fusca]